MDALHRAGRCFSPHMQGELLRPASTNGRWARARAEDGAGDGSGERTGGAATLGEEAARGGSGSPDPGSKAGGSSGGKRRRRSPERRPKRRQRGRSMDPNWQQLWSVRGAWPPFATQEQVFGGMVPDFGQPPFFPPQVGQPVGEGTSKEPVSSNKGSKAGSKPKLANFSPSVGQRKSAFWKRIEDAYNRKKGSGHPKRSLRSLEGRWDFIKEQTAAAITRYNALEKWPFAVPHCWEALKNEAKWLDLLDSRNMGGQNTEDNAAGAMDDIAPDPEESQDASSRARKRPMGRDAAKEARKRSSSTSGSQTSEYVSKMSEMHLQRTSFWHEANGQMNERLDKLVEIEQTKTDIEHEKVGIGREKAAIEKECLQME